MLGSVKPFTGTFFYMGGDNRNGVFEHAQNTQTQIHPI